MKVQTTSNFLSDKRAFLFYGQNVNVRTAEKAPKPLDFDSFQRASIPQISVVRPIAFGSRTDASNIKLGCNLNEENDKLEFGIYSKNATKINLYIFDKPVNGNVVKEVSMKNNDGKWVAEIDKDNQDALDLDVNGPVYYGFRAWGPNWEYDKNWKPGNDAGFISHYDEKGNRFNPNKLLTDPYAREISHDPVSPAVQGKFVDETLYATGDKYYLNDSGPLGPKSIFVKHQDVSTGTKPTRRVKDDVIYEVHPRGFTMLDETIPEQYRGTYKGAGMKAKYLKELGVTMVEFLPVQEFQNDANDHPYRFENGQNYWGYETKAFFAPDRRYSYDKSPGGPTREFKEMVKAFHDEGIKVGLDVVYNHTGEGALWKDEKTKDKDKNTTELYSMKGLDNQTYYELCDNSAYYWDDTGCGANFNCANPAVRDLIVDSTKYWANEMGVDAFRHDIAPVLGNSKQKHGFSFEPNNKDLYPQKVRQELGPDVDLIAEPWGGTKEAGQEGNFPSHWIEWSGQYKNILRNTFNYPQDAQLGRFASAISGLKDVFKGDKARTINYIDCHDGMPMFDIFNYNERQNNQKGFSSDGGDEHEISSKMEPTQQKKVIRNSFLTLMVSKGTPMILGGDEVMRTQHGNNNAYNQDKPLNYINWNLNNDKENMQEFVKRAMHFRNSHAALRDNKYYNGRDNNNNGLKDITWMDRNSSEVSGAEYFDNADQNFLAFRIDGTEFGDSASSIYTALNKGDYNQEVHLPENLPGKSWYFVADTSEYSEKYNNFKKEGEEVETGKKHNISPRSMLLFIEKEEAA